MTYISRSKRRKDPPKRRVFTQVTWPESTERSKQDKVLCHMTRENLIVLLRDLCIRLERTKADAESWMSIAHDALESHKTMLKVRSQYQTSSDEPKRQWWRVWERGWYYLKAQR